MLKKRPPPPVPQLAPPEAERETSDDVPTSWRHPDDIGLERRRNRIMLAIIAILSLILIIALILLSVAYSRYSSITCPATKSYYIAFADNSAVYNDSLTDPTSEYFIAKKTEYEAALKTTTNGAGYRAYSVQADNFRPSTQTQNELKQGTPGVQASATVVLEALEGTFPAQAAEFQRSLDASPQKPSAWNFIHSSTNPTDICSDQPAPSPTEGTHTCPTARPCPTDCPTWPTVPPTTLPYRPTVPPTTLPHSPTVPPTTLPYRPTVPAPVPICQYRLDLVLVVEDTNVLPDNVSEDSVKSFLTGIVGHFVLGVDYAHVALLLYNNQTQVIFSLNSFIETSKAQAQIHHSNFTYKDALRYTMDHVLTSECGDRYCYPDTIVLVSYSSNSDPNPDEALHVATQLRSFGASILTVGIGPENNAGLLTSIAGKYGHYYNVSSFSNLTEDVSDAIGNRSCAYQTTHIYPCDMDNITADIVFVVDTSTSLTNLEDAVIGFISNYLSAYTFSPDAVQAALVTYSSVGNVALGLNDTNTSSDFIFKARAALDHHQSDNERNISRALDLTLNQVLTSANGYRPSALHLILVISAGCFTGPDPIPYAEAIRNGRGQLYVVSLGAQFNYWKSLMGVAGDAQHLYQVRSSAGVILPEFLPAVIWPLLCPDNCYLTTPAPCTGGTTPSSAATTQPSTGHPTSSKLTTFTTERTTNATESTSTPATTITTTAATTITTTATTTIATTAATTIPPGPQRCPADVVFLIDESSSITTTNFDSYIKPFIINLTYGLNLGPDRSHLGLIRFSDIDATRAELYLDQGCDPDEIADLIRKLPFSAGDAALYSALQLALFDVYVPARGARTEKYGDTVAAYAIIITGGLATDSGKGDPAELTYYLMNSNIAVYAVGVGPLVTASLMEGLTYDPSRAYNVSTFSDLTRGLVDRILNDTFCPMDFAWPSSKPEPEYCDAIDLMFVLDESATVVQQNPSNFAVLRDFLINLTKIFTIRSKNTRVAVVGYGRSAGIDISFLDTTDAADLQLRIATLPYRGGARNVTAGFEAARIEIETHKRFDAPVYLVHIAEYAHDVGGDPVNVANHFRDMGVKVFAVAIQDFQWDDYFQAETAAIVSAGANGSMQFNVTNYNTLLTSTIRDTFVEIIRDFPCATKSPSLADKYLGHFYGKGDK